MNKMTLCTLATALIVTAGCKKQEDSKPAPAPPEEVAEQPTATAPVVKEQPKAMTQTIKEEAVSALTVKAEDVMAELNESVDTIREKAAGLDKTQLTAYADQYKTVLLEKKEQFAALAAQVKALPVTELMGEKAKALKEQLSQHTGQLQSLQERYTVYLDQMKTFGVDLSDYML